MPNPDLFVAVDRYIDELFAPEDEVLTGALARSKAGGLPDIQVSAGQGKFFYLLAKLVGARNILELGTLGGYSTIWLARALPEGGKLTTLEYEPRHAEVARANFVAAGLADKIEVVVGAATDMLPGVIDRAGPFDLVFVDADKHNYPNYLREIMRGVRSGSLILGDNVVRRGGVLDPKGNANSLGAREFNALIAADPRLEAVVLQQVGIKGHDGIAVARVN